MWTRPRFSAARLLPANRIVVEILETVSPTPEVIQAWSDLCESGYTLALDDFADHPKWEPLIRLAKYLKVDFRDCDADARCAIAKCHRSNGVHLLAQKVETQEEMKQARAFGYSFFQGFFFWKPVMVEGKDIPGSKLTYIQLLEAIAEPELSYPRIEELLKHEPSLVLQTAALLEFTFGGAAY